MCIKKGPVPAGPSKNINKKMRNDGLPGSHPVGPTYSTVWGSLQNFDLCIKNEFFRILTF
jgi:hypothetical protein